MFRRLLLCVMLQLLLSCVEAGVTLPERVEPIEMIAETIPQGVPPVVRIPQAPRSCPSPFVSEALVASVIERVRQGVRAKYFLVREVNAPEGDFLIVFRANGVRYTLEYWAATASTRSSLNVWTRPEGTISPSLVSAFTDEQVDGCINFGIDHREQFLSWNAAHADNVGGEHHLYWQDAYNEAIRTLDRFLTL